MSTVSRARVLRVLIAIVAVLVLLFAAVWLFQRKLIYLPDSTPVPPAGEVLPGASDVRLRTSDGLELGAWLVPPAQPGPRALVLVANGNAGNRVSRAPLAAALSRAGMAVLLLDYRGYGGNPGSPSEDGLKLDVRAAHRYVTEHLRVPASQLIYYGESLGCAVVTELATEHPPAGMLLRSPFTDLAATGQEHYPFLPVRLMLRDTFPVAEHITRVKAPVTVVLGTDDNVVPPQQSRDVARAGSARLVEIAGADHNDRVLLDGRQLIDAVTALLP
ncbi:MAG: alpha/beta fold hydrolase [Kibdelosporangium sp.]